jgi:hypothetical protein
VCYSTWSWIIDQNEIWKKKDKVMKSGLFLFVSFLCPLKGHITPKRGHFAQLGIYSPKEGITRVAERPREAIHNG